MRPFFFRLLLIAALVSWSSCQDQTSRVVETYLVTDINEFTGHWSFDIKGGGVGWLDVRQENDYLDADLLWIGGSVLPVAHVFLAGDGVLHVTRISDRIRLAATGDVPRVHKVTRWIEAKTDGDKISGQLLVPRANGIGVDSTWFWGVKLPDVPPAPNLSSLQFGEPIELFNGKDLTGWRLTNENHVNGWKAVDGILVNDIIDRHAYDEVLEPGETRIRFGHLRTDQEFEDFNLTLEVNVPAGSNSGVFLRGMYEIQVLDTYGREPYGGSMGALYSRIIPMEAAEKPAGEWQTMDITLADRHMTVILNGIKIIDNQPVYGPTGGALQSNVFAPGPIFMQGDHGSVSFRNLVLTPVIN